MASTWRGCWCRGGGVNSMKFLNSKNPVAVISVSVDQQMRTLQVEVVPDSKFSVRAALAVVAFWACCGHGLAFDKNDWERYPTFILL